MTPEREASSIGRRDWTDWSMSHGPRFRVRDAKNHIGIVSDAGLGGKWTWLVVGSRAKGRWCMATCAGLDDTMEGAMAQADAWMLKDDA